MKQYISFLSFLLIMLFFSSCNNEETVAESFSPDPKVGCLQISPNEEKEIAALSMTIRQYNNPSLSGEYTMNKSIWSWFKKKWRTVVTVAADALGTAVSGNIVIGIISSGAVGAATVIQKPNINVNIGVGTPVRQKQVAFTGIVCPANDNLQTMQLNDSIGYYHNAILYDVFNDTTFVKDNCNTHEDLLNVLVQRIDSLYPTALSSDEAIRKQQIQQASNISSVLVEVLTSSTSYEDFMDKLKEKNVVPSAVIDLLKEYCYGLLSVDLEGNDGKYLQEMLDYLKKANLSTTTKTAIGNSFIVGNASNQMWNTEPNN